MDDNRRVALVKIPRLTARRFDHPGGWSRSCTNGPFCIQNTVIASQLFQFTVRR